MNKYILVAKGTIRAASDDLDTIVKRMLYFNELGLKAAIYRLEAEVIEE